MGICEAGHTSASDDYCDTCGLPVHPAPPAQQPVPQAGSGTQHCPHCRAVNPSDALFCEACGYDYTTGALPRQDLHAELGLTLPDSPAPLAAPVSLGVSQPADGPAGAGEASGRIAGDGSGRVTGVPGPEDGVPSPGSGVPGHEGGVPGHEGDVPGPEGGVPGQGDGVTGEDHASAVGDVPPPIGSSPSTVPSVPPGQATDAAPHDVDEPTRGRPAPRRELWVAEVWVDPDWYGVQDSPDPMPSVGLPDTVKLTDTNLIGRPSTSRGIVPDIDCGADTGCSRRQAELTADGSRWFIEDLGSANGTFLAKAAGPLPTEPLTVRTEVGSDDRIYVGAWTRIVVRKASKEEYDAL